MGQGNYETEFCRGCKRAVDSVWWVAALNTRVCYKCRDQFQTDNPNWKIDEAKSRMDKAYELYLLEKEAYEKLL